MGINNSSEKVAMPLMSALHGYDLKNFDVIKFLSILNGMTGGIQKPDFQTMGNVMKVHYTDEEHRVKEFALRTSKARIEYLLDHANEYLNNQKIETSEVCEKTKRRRKFLISENESERQSARREAQRLLEDNWRKKCENKEYERFGKAWWVLEGSSMPDIFIETSQYVFVGEVKWTEPGTTDYTTYDPERQQLVRHIEGAFEYIKHQYGTYDSKQVVSFFVLDDDFIEKDKKKGNHKSKLDLISAGDKSMWDKSLKHYDADVVEKYKQTYIGYIAVSQIEELDVQIQNKIK